MNRRGDLKQVHGLRGGTMVFGALQAIGKSKETRTKQQGGRAEKSTQSSARGERVHHIALYWQTEGEAENL